MDPPPECVASVSRVASCSDRRCPPANGDGAESIVFDAGRHPATLSALPVPVRPRSLLTSVKLAGAAHPESAMEAWDDALAL